MNPIEKAAEAVGHGIKVAAVDTVHVVEDVVTIGHKLIKVIEDGRALTPAFKQELATLINDAKTIATAAAPAVATGGANLGVDLGVLEPVVAGSVKLASDFVHFLPELEAALKKIEADLVQ